MPRLDPHTLETLRAALEMEHGAPITTKGDCDALSHAIRRRLLSETVSSQTLRRLFGLIPGNKSGFETGTLTILARYLGMQDYEELLELMRKGRDPILEAQITILKNLAQGVEPEQDHPWIISDHFVRLMISNEPYRRELATALIKSPLGQKQLMECFPLIDHINNPEYRGLLKEYLQLQSEETRPRTELFVYGLCGIGAYMSGQRELLSHYAELLSRLPVTEELPQQPVARRYGVLLLSRLCEGKEIAPLWSELLEVRKRYQEFARDEICNFDYILLEQIIVSDRWDLMAQLCSDTAYHQGHRYYLPTSRQYFHRQVWQIFTAAARVAQGRRAEAEALLREADLSHIEVGLDCLTRLQYLLVLLHFDLDNTRRSQARREMAQLVERTGFVRFLELMEQL
ncbi:hypothetical protein [Porphyromonas bennonis]|uniref:hypothetical protein n=1 Tax=Porphyromonas bennonis TaxID=501496 RepID=UPI00036ED4C7|nr:hypothetical protein [Porphyromonas bennonis]